MDGPARGTPGLAHLSTNLCPAHREQVLAAVRGRLDRGEPCTLVATQCVEAGVDIDFPLVYRALGPLESIAQAAGRCNRNGRLGHLGEVEVFRPEDDRYPPGGYTQAAHVTRALVEVTAQIGTGSDAQAVQPAHDRLTLVGHMLRVAPARQDDHVRSDRAQRDLAVLWASIQDRVSSR